ncbi:MAG: hypothetical protein HY237_10555 [Acidobacteria bacterium]|nr:hypothetical protein [Acidobacteriota bacterium]
MVFGMSLLLVQSALPYEHPLDGHTVREAYFLGQRHDEKTAKFLARYLKRPPLPKTGPHVAEIEIRTPYEQVVRRASQAAGSYSAQQAEQDYRAHPDRIVVRVRINLTPTYPAFIADPSRGKGEVRERPEDFWRDFSIRLVQGERITPRNASGRPLHTGGLAGPNPVVGALEGAEVLLEFDASQIRSEPLKIEVLTPNGQTVEVEFDLKELR